MKKVALLVLLLTLALVFTVPPAVTEGTITLPALVLPKATVIFGGDMMFDRTVRTYMHERGGDYIFSCIGETLHNADLVVANLEGPITSSASVSEGTVPGTPDNFRFTFDPEVASLLYAHNIKLVNIGNNHIMDFGFSGFKETKRWLESAEVAYIGSEIVHKTVVNGIPLAFISYNEFGWEDYSSVLQKTAIAKSEGYLPIIYLHWGEEYVEPLPRVEALARQFVDAGASLVVGSHPHIVQEREEYRGKYIYYSLGNFIFDQYFNEEVTHGLLLKVTVSERGVEKIEELPIELMRDRRTCLDSTVRQ